MDITTKKNEIKKYRESPALSQSFLKKVLANDVTEDKQDSVFMSRGSYADDLLTYGEDYIGEMYAVIEGSYPTPMWKNTIEYVFNNSLPVDKESLIQAFRDTNKSKLLDDNVITGFEENWYYYEALKDSNGKPLITQEDAIKSELAVHNFKNHPFVKHIFEVEGDYQVPLYWNYTTGYYHDEQDIDVTVVECKGLLDRLNIDRVNKTVQIVDFKLTSESLYQWPRGLCRKFNVPFQLSYYHYGLNQNLHTLGLEGYKILFPAVLIENMNYPGKPRIYNLTAQDLIHGSHGYERSVSTVITEGEIHQPEIYKKKGWMEAIYIYVKSKQLDLVDYDIDYHTSKGVYELNAFI